MTDAEIAAALQDAFWQTAERLMLHHTNPWELDQALTGWGYDMGPCEAQDLRGLTDVLAQRPARDVPILPRMVAEGRMGKIGGVGYYRYPGGGGAVIDPLIEDLIREEAWFAKVERSELDNAALVAAMNASLAATVAALAQRGIARDRLNGALHGAVHFPQGRSL